MKVVDNWYEKMLSKINKNKDKVLENVYFVEITYKGKYITGYIKENDIPNKGEKSLVNNELRKLFKINNLKWSFKLA